MKTKKVKDLMIPLEEYATVSQEATLHDAILALEEAQEKFTSNVYQHRAVLVLDDNQKVVGKISQITVLKALEPKYDEVLSDPALQRFGWDRESLKAMMTQFNLLNQPMDDICRKASKLVVKNFMHKLSNGEYIKEESGLNEAINLFVVGRFQSLLVSHDNTIVGVLRLTDVFQEVCQAIKQCQVDL